MFDVLTGTHVGTESTLITFADNECHHSVLPDPVPPDSVEEMDYEGKLALTSVVSAYFSYRDRDRS
jgi:hypothetical protein